MSFIWTVSWFIENHCENIRINSSWHPNGFVIDKPDDFEETVLNTTPVNVDTVFLSDTFELRDAQNKDPWCKSVKEPLSKKCKPQAAIFYRRWNTL